MTTGGGQRRAPLSCDSRPDTPVIYLRSLASPETCVYPVNDPASFITSFSAYGPASSASLAWISRVRRVVLPCPWLYLSSCTYLIPFSCCVVYLCVQRGTGLPFDCYESRFVGIAIHLWRSGARRVCTGGLLKKRILKKYAGSWHM